MLQSIYIQNYALIDKLDINFTSGFSVITGETGAGKSIILGAIGLLLGQRADIKAIKNGASKCIVEAHFHISNYGMESFFAENDIEYDPEECILRREVSINGKSRAFINDTPASLAQMKRSSWSRCSCRHLRQHRISDRADTMILGAKQRRPE